MKKKLLFAAFLVLLIISIVVAVDWYPAALKESWNRRSTGFCSSESQCLVSSAGDRGLNNQPNRFFTDTKPYCVNATQFILDNYCENGGWSSRTKLLALEFLKVANAQSPDDFSLFCSSPEKALNNLEYEVDNVLVSEYFRNCHPFDSTGSYPCINSVCVLKYSDGVAFGTSLNIPVDDENSFLNALDVSKNKCDSVKNDNNRFDFCGDNIWYNHDTESIVVLPESYLGSNLPSANINPESSFIVQPFDVLNSLAESSNLDMFSKTRLFNNIYFAKKGNKKIFSFLEKDQTEFGYDYIGLFMENIEISNFCEDVVYNVDDGVLCSDAGDLLVIAKKTPEIDDSLVNLWADMTAKLRLS
ncbi:hypothetical protein GF358_00735 [Candidatus Woesearchaeota archaeon]|nr:hypothetical protein [Candidatus Woesearchaeota archaeon]